MASGLASFALGLGGGYLQGQQRQLEEKRQGLRDSMVKTQFDWQQQDRAREDELRQGLAQAAQPASVQPVAPLVANDDDGNPMPAPGLWQTAGKQYTSEADARRGATAHNAPAARLAREADVYASRGLAGSVQARQIQAQQQALQEQSRRYGEENYGEALRALTRGDGAGAAAAFNRSGKLRIEGDIALAPAERDIPGIGKIKTYDATFNMVGEDGKARPMKINTHDALMQSMPYEKQLELQRKGSDSDARVQQGLAQLDLKGKQIELQGEIAATRAARAGAGNSDKSSREERMRFTSLFTEAGRRMSDAQRALQALQKDPMYAMAKPGSQQAREMDDLRSSIQGYQEERKTYGSLLAGSQAGAPTSPGLADAPPRAGGQAAAPAPAQPKGGQKVAKPAAQQPTDFSHLWK